MDAGAGIRQLATGRNPPDWFSIGHPAGRQRTRWTWPTIASTVVHVALLAVFFVSQFSKERPAGSTAGATIVDVMAVPVLPPAPQAQPPPTPEPPRPEPKRTSELPPLPRADENVSADTLLVPEHDPEPASLDKPLSSEPVPDLLYAAIDYSAPPAPEQAQQAAPVEGNQAGAAGTAEQTWEGMVLAALERQKRYPTASQRRREQDIVYVRMTLDREGRVIDARIHKSRRYAALDAEVLELVRRASPLPKPPDEVTGDRIDLIVPVEFFLSRARR